MRHIKEYVNLKKMYPESVEKYKSTMDEVRTIMVSGKPFEQKTELGRRSYKEVFLVPAKWGSVGCKYPAVKVQQSALFNISERVSLF